LLDSCSSELSSLHFWPDFWDPPQYQLELLSFGKARELAQMEYRDFSTLLGERNITRHYTEIELAEDLDYAHR
jgi:hypothetical protein